MCPVGVRTHPTFLPHSLILLMQLASCSILLSLLLGTALPAAPTILRGPYLQSATPSSIVVRWRTDTTEASVVSYGTARHQLTSVVKSEGISAEHIVYLTGLAPATT